MNSPQVQHERRTSQRFPFQIPLGLKVVADGRQDCGLTQNMSARGVFFYTDTKVSEGSSLELTLVMPTEISLSESTRVRCQGKCLRVTGPEIGNKFGIAAVIERYDFLPEAETLRSSRFTGGQ
jgi:hypothetical protein